MHKNSIIHHDVITKLVKQNEKQKKNRYQLDHCASITLTHTHPHLLFPVKAYSE